MRYIHVIILAFIVTLLVGLIAVSLSSAESTPTTLPSNLITYQGKDVHWWAKKAQQARKDANVRRNTIARLKRTVRTTYSVRECVRLATITYPALSEDRAWRIIGGESKGNPNARNKSPVWNGEHALGLWQFLLSTFNSTPYGKAGMSIWSPCASSLAAGWMHEHGRGGEWAGY